MERPAFAHLSLSRGTGRPSAGDPCCPLSSAHTRQLCLQASPLGSDHQQLSPQNIPTSRSQLDTFPEGRPKAGSRQEGTAHCESPGEADGEPWVSGLGGWGGQASLHTCCVRAKLVQLCPTLRDPMDCSPPGSSVHGVLQARILERVAMPSSRGSPPPRV